MIMSEEIIKVLDYITEKLGVAIDWTAENALPYVEELIGKFVTYNIVKSSIILAVGLLMATVVVGVLVVIGKSYSKCKRLKQSTYFWEYWNSGIEVEVDAVGSCALILTIPTAISIACTIIGLGNLIEWSVIPEMALLEEIKYLVG